MSQGVTLTANHCPYHCGQPMEYSASTDYRCRVCKTVVSYAAIEDMWLSATAGMANSSAWQREAGAAAQNIANDALRQLQMQTALRNEYAQVALRNEYAATAPTQPKTSARTEPASRYRDSKYASAEIEPHVFAPDHSRFAPDHSAFQPDETAHLFQRSL